MEFICTRSTSQKNDCLEHHGILGQKWGVRRFQNEDGTLTAAGKKRYNSDSDAMAKATSAKYEALYNLNKKRQENPGANPNDLSSQMGREYREAIIRTKKAFNDAEKLTKSLMKKYKDVDVDILTEDNTGEQYVQTKLRSKTGETYISEFYLGAHIEE